MNDDATPRDQYPYAEQPIAYDGFGVPVPGLGTPAQHPASVTPGKPTGKQLLSATWRLLRQDLSLLWLPVLGALMGLTAALIIFVPAIVFTWSPEHGANRVAVWVAGAATAFVVSAIGIYLQAALVLAANWRADGHTPTVGQALAGAWKLKRQILGWAALTSSVGLVIRLLEQRLGIFGRLLGFIGIVAWAIASFFVVPVIVTEGLGPVDAIKKSSDVLKRTWGTAIRSTLRFGALQILAGVVLWLAAIAGGLLIALAGVAGAVVGSVLLVAAGSAFIALVVISGALAIYARALLYRYAIGLPVPGIDPALFAGAFKPKRLRRRSK